MSDQSHQSPLSSTSIPSRLLAHIYLPTQLLLGGGSSRAPRAPLRAGDGRPVPSAEWQAHRGGTPRRTAGTSVALLVRSRAVVTWQPQAPAVDPGLEHRHRSRQAGSGPRRSRPCHGGDRIPVDADSGLRLQKAAVLPAGAGQPQVRPRGGGHRNGIRARGEPRRSARRAARTRAPRASAARRARSYRAVVRLRISGRSAAWYSVSLGYRARRSAAILRPRPTARVWSSTAACTIRSSRPGW